MSQHEGYKSSEELGLPEAAYENMFVVRDALLDGKLQHVHSGKEGTKDTCGFNMSHWKGRGIHGCGTVACVAGWTETFAQMPYGSLNELACSLRRGNDDGLYNLFFPNNYSIGANYPPARAAHAIDTYLKTGTPDWSKHKRSKHKP